MHFVLLLPAFIIPAVVQSDYLIPNRWFGSPNSFAKYPERGKRLLGEVTFDRCRKLCHAYPKLCFAFDHYSASNTCVMYKESMICDDQDMQGGPWPKKNWDCFSRDICPGKPKPVPYKPYKSSGFDYPKPPKYSRLLQYLLTNFNIDIKDEAGNLIDEDGRQASTSNTQCSSAFKVYTLYNGQKTVGTESGRVLRTLHVCVWSCEQSSTCRAVNYRLKLDHQGYCTLVDSTADPLVLQKDSTTTPYLTLQKYCPGPTLLTTTAPTTVTTLFDTNLLNPALTMDTEFSCDNQWQYFANTSVPGGTVNAATTVNDCLLACTGMSTCVAADFNNDVNTNKCFLHTQATLDAALAAQTITVGSSTCCTHYLRARGSSLCSDTYTCYVGTLTEMLPGTAVANIQEVTDLANAPTTQQCPGLCKVTVTQSVTFGGVPLMVMTVTNTVRECDNSGSDTEKCTVDTATQTTSCRCRGSLCNGLSTGALKYRQGYWPLDGTYEDKYDRPDEDLYVEDRSYYERKGKQSGVTYSPLIRKKGLSACFNGEAYITLPTKNLHYNDVNFATATNITTPRLLWALTFWFRRDGGTTDKEVIFSNQIPALSSIQIESTVPVPGMQAITATLKVLTDVTGVIGATPTMMTYTVTSPNLEFDKWYFVAVELDNVGATDVKLDLHTVLTTIGSPAPVSVQAPQTNPQQGMIALTGSYMCVGKQAGAEPIFPFTNFFKGYIDEIMMIFNSNTDMSLQAILEQTSR